MRDEYAHFTTGLSDVLSNGQHVTPSDDQDLPYVTRGIYVANAGNVKLTLKGGQTITLNKLGENAFLPFRATRIHATGTTASDFVIFW